MSEAKRPTSVNFRGVVKADAAAFLGIPDYAVRHLRRVGSEYFRKVGQDDYAPYQEWSNDFVRNPANAVIKVGDIGRLASAGFAIEAHLKGKACKVTEVDSKEFLTVMTDDLQEQHGIPAKAFIPNAILEKAGYPAVLADVFVFKVANLAPALDRALATAKPIALDVSQKFLLFSFKDKFSVWSFNKSNMKMEPCEHTGLYPSIEHINKITGLVFA